MTQRRIYQDECPYFITTNTHNREWFFADGKYALALYKIIIEACRIKHFDLLAFCILPEHLHLMAQKNAGADYSRTLEKVRWDWDKQNYHFININPSAQRGLSSLRGFTISDLLQSIKGNFSRKIHIGNIWQSRFNSRFVNTEKRFENTLNYILYNYQKHNLPGKYSVYPYQYINNKLINCQ